MWSGDKQFSKRQFYSTKYSLKCHLQDDGGSYPGILRTRGGGVARNHADALTRLGCETKLISAIGNDRYGETLMSMCGHMDMSSILRVDDVQTATYLSVALKGNVLYGVTAIEPIVARLTSEVITSKEELIAEADAVVVDGNLTREALKTAIALAHHHQKFIWFDPADQSKVEKLFAAKSFELIDAISPNANEFDRLMGFQTDVHPLLSTIAETRGPEGVTWWQRKGEQYVKTKRPSPIDPKSVVSVSGAGDCLNCGYLAALLSGLSLEKCYKVADACARLSLQSLESVPDTITPDCLDKI
ncbi:hypothetical protein L596_015963 [Steinernema carpocapsae]|uniref:Carbohydrate kinase PfkB domain-containing protein n=1 Tax=Steinernema carpocapsae TaxID=34508 RepID=A0A4U5NHD4_STECR|nr:hypothetical protein L596_015963 [Steinernema carpocapsae]